MAAIRCVIHLQLLQKFFQHFMYNAMIAMRTTSLSIPIPVISFLHKERNVSPGLSAEPAYKPVMERANTVKMAAINGKVYFFNFFSTNKSSRFLSHCHSNITIYEKQGVVFTR